MIIKSVLTTEVIFNYTGDLNDLNVQEYIENECPIYENTKHKDKKGYKVKSDISRRLAGNRQEYDRL